MGDSVVMLVHRLYPTPPRTEYGHERPNLFCPFRPLRFLQLHFWSVSLLQTKSAAHRSLANREAAFGGRKSPGDHLGCDFRRHSIRPAFNNEVFERFSCLGLCACLAGRRRHVVRDCFGWLRLESCRRWRQLMLGSPSHEHAPRHPASRQIIGADDIGRERVNRGLQARASSAPLAWQSADTAPASCRPHRTCRPANRP